MTSNTKAIHICNSHKLTHNQKLQKSMSCNHKKPGKFRDKELIIIIKSVPNILSYVIAVSVQIRALSLARASVSV